MCSIVGAQGDRARVILVLRKYTWNARAVSLVLPASNATGSLGSPPRRVVYSPVFMVPPWVTVSRFHAGNKKAELKSTSFSSLLTSQRYSTFECCLLGLLVNNIIWLT